MAGSFIDALPAATSAELTDVFPVDQLPGPVTRQGSNAQLLSLFQSNGQALTASNDTNVTMTLGGSPSTALLNASSMTLGWAGQLSVPRGGTGNSTFTAYSLLCAGTTSTGAFQNVVGTGSLNQALISNGPGALPSWQTIDLVIPAALTSANDTNVTLTLGGTPTTALLQASSITAGWTGTLSGTRGGTGVNNGASTITIGGNHTLSGAFASTFTFTNTTSVTFPTSGTLATTSQIPSGTALTEVNDTNVTLTLGGSPSTALVNSASITAGWSGQLSLSRGGTNASLTASNGGIFYSNASSAAILSGTSTAGQLLTSGASTTPAWSTSTYPLTNAANTLLYASSANTMAALATANNGVLVTSSGGVPSIGNTVGAGLTMPSITFNSTTGVVGTTTNDSAASGSVGEFVSSSVPFASATSISTTTATNLTSISLTAGDWDVWGNVTFVPAATTTVNSWQAGISTISATLPDPSLRQSIVIPSTTVPGSGAIISANAPMQRLSLSATTTVYIVGFTTFATSTMTQCGYIYARRRR